MESKVRQFLQPIGKSCSKIFELKADTDYFHLLKPFETLIGYNMPSWNRKKRFGWDLMAALIVLFYLHQCWKVRNTIVVWEGLNNFLGTFGLCLTYGTTLMQVYVIRSTSTHQNIVRMFINGRQNRTKNLRHCWDKRAKCFRVNVWFTLISVGVCFVNVVMFFLTGAYDKPEYVVRMDLGADLELVSEFIRMLSCLWFIVCALATMMNFVWINSLLNAMKTELEILVDIFDELGTSGGDFRDEFKIAVQKHQQYFDCFEHMQYLTSPSFFIQYYPAQTIIALVIVMFGYERGSGLEVGYLAHGTLLFLQFWYICNHIENLESKCCQIAEIIYDLPWFAKRSRGMSRSYMLVIARSQRGLQFRCGGFFRMSMESFADMLRKSSTLLTFMLSFKK